MENFDAVYAAHFQAVYRFLLGLCRSAPLAEELCQEAFVQAMRDADAAGKKYLANH